MRPIAQNVLVRNELTQKVLIVLLCLAPAVTSCSRAPVGELPPVPAFDSSGFLPVIQQQIQTAADAVAADPLDALVNGKFAMVLVGGGALVGLVFPDALLRLFLHDEHTIALARFPLRLLGATMTIETLGGVLMNALLGAGASRLVMHVSIGMQWGLFLPAAYLLGPVLGLGLSAVWSAQVAYRVLQALVFAMVWRSQAWIDLEV